MVLSSTSYQLGEWFEILVESVSGIEAIIGLVVLIAGIVGTGWQTMISVNTIIGSYNIEIGLMSKKERVKLNATSMTIFVIALILFNLLGSHVAVSFQANKALIECGIIAFFALGVSFTVIVLLLFVTWLINRLSKVQVCRFVGAILKKILFKIGSIVKRKTAGLRRMCCKFADIIKRCEMVVKMSGWCSRCRQWIVEVWKGCEREGNSKIVCKRTFEQQLRISGFLIITVFGVVFNYLLAHHANAYENVYIYSIVVTIMTLEIALTLLKFHMTPEDSRIYYYDDVKKKDVFIYFRQDDKYCIGGDSNILGCCEEYYLVSYDKLEKQRLYSIARWKQDKTVVNNKCIRLQNNQNEVVLSDLFDKVKDELKNQGIAVELLEAADICINLEDKKVHYVLPEEAEGDIEL